MKAIILLISVALVMAAGHWSDSIAIDTTKHTILLQMLESVRPLLEAESGNGKSFAQYIPVSYISQVVAGTNYKVKIQVDANEYIHASIFVPLQFMNQAPKIREVITNMKSEDPL